MRVKMPRKLNEQEALKFSRSLIELPEDDHYEFDATEIEFALPFGMLVTAASIRAFARERLLQDDNFADRFSIIECGSSDYISHMGFYQSCGFDLGKEPGEARGSDQYIPITRTQEKEFAARSNWADNRTGQGIEIAAKEMAQILVQEERGILVTALRYSITEMVRNVFEHSEAKEVWYAAQYWQNSDSVQLAILDEGVGIRSSLRRNPEHRPEDDEEALEIALSPGTSGSSKRPKKRDVWANLGYGLHVTSYICRKTGSFYIASGRSCKALFTSESSHNLAMVSGTAIGMKTSLHRLKAFQSLKAEATEGFPQKGEMNISK